jgi:hypothetical protein
MIEMNTPKRVGCLVCGFCSENVIEIEEFQDKGCPDCKAFLCGVCGQYIRENEKDQIGFHLPEFCKIKIRSVFVECREWFDKVNGNSYFSARIWINGGQVAIIPFSYGYGDFYIYEAQKKLLELGYLPQENKNNSLFTISQQMGFDFYSSKTNTKKSEMFKHYANYQERKAGN